MEEKQADTKVWFLYVVDHHEGPFTPEEILKRVKKGEVPSKSFVWKDGMPDWIMMTELGDFKAAEAKKGTVPKMSAPKSARKVRLGPIFTTLFVLAILYQCFATGVLDPVLKKTGLSVSGQAMHLPAAPLKPLVKKISPMLPKKIRAMLSPVELPEDVPEQDAEVLVDAASASLDEGARIAMYISPTDLVSPIFLIAGNVPDGTKLEVVVKGREGTLLNVRKFETKTEAVFQKFLARTKPLATADGKAIPKGQYTIIAYEADQQPPEVSLALAAAPRKTAPSGVPQGKTVVSLEMMFLGGKKDAPYEEKLKAWNEKVKKQLDAEGTELRQIQATLESMANESARRFFTMTAKPVKGAALKKRDAEWKKYHEEYEKMSVQIQTQFAPNPERMFPVVYGEAEKTWDLTEKLHKLENDFFSKKATMDEIRTQAAAALEAINHLKATITETVK